MATPGDADVQITDLEVVQRYSLAVRAATAPRDELAAVLEADLAWLTGGAGRRPAAPAEDPAAAPRPAARKSVRKAPVRRPPEA